MAKKKVHTKKKSRGFGESQIPTRTAKRLMVAFGQKEGDDRTLYLTAHPEKLDESLLDALPLVFEKIIKGKPLDHRRSIAGMFVHFGALLWKFPKGIRWLNLELSITAYERALKVLTRDAFPQDWAKTQMNLGLAYSDRIRGERAENLEVAIATYERALQILTRDAFPQDWARTQANLGLAYSNRIRGERAENLEVAIAAYEQALQIHTCDAFPEDWAINQHNLANAYRDRVRGNSEKNIEQSMALYGQAAQVFTQAAYPHKWFCNQANLATAYLARAALHPTDSDKRADLDTAVTLLQTVLETANPNAPTPDYIDAQYQLGTALTRRHDLTQDATDLQLALDAYKIALEAISPEHYDREKMWQALPETQIILGSRLVRDGEWHKGLELLQSAITQLRPKGDLLSLANAYYQLGLTHEVMAHVEDARICYRDALRLYKRIDNEPGMARSYHSLGAILGSKGYLSKAMIELANARSLYQKLGMAEKVAEINDLYQAAERGKQEFENLGLGVAV